MKIGLYVFSLLTIFGFSVFGCKGNVSDFVENENEKNQSIDTVWMVGVKFEPSELFVNRGDTVVWINRDIVAHNVTQLPNKAWTSGNIEKNESWRMVIKEEFDYYCTIHPPMKGAIKIKE